MALYRIYWVVAQNNYYKLANSIECVTDEEARREAQKMINGYAALELWESTRLVARIEEDAAAPAPPVESPK